MAEAIVAAAHRAGDEVERLGRQADPGWFIEDQARIDQRRDHHDVPVGKDLVVAPGPYARAAGGEKFLAQACEPCLLGLAAWLRLKPVENIVAFEIAGRRDVVVPGKEFALLDAELAEH